MATPLEKIELEVAEVIRERLTNVTGREVLVRLSEAGLVERGCVVLLGLDAIRDRLGERWARRREQVWEAAIAHITRKLGPTDVCARVSETDIALAVLAGRDHAQVLGIKCLQELLVFFLGAYRAEDMKVQSIAWISDDEISCVPLDAPAQLLDDRPTPTPPAPSEKAPLADVMRRWSSLSFTGGGMVLDAALVLETLVSLKKKGAPAAVGLRVHPTATDRATGRRTSPYGRANLTLSEQIAVDQATLEFAAHVLPVDSGALIVPISFEVASSSRGRAFLSRWMTENAEAVAARVILEIVHVDAGTPRGRLVELTASLHPRVPRLMVRAEPTKAMLASLRECRIGGISIDCGTPATGDATALLAAFGAAAKGLAPMLCALGAANVAMAETAREAGFTHASLSSN